MKIFIIAVVLLSFYDISSAAMLLIPSFEIEYDNYSARCTVPEYICTTDYFLSILKNHKTPQFDKLMNDVDLSSPKFPDEFRNKIINILNTEDLDRTQLSMLLDLLKHINSLQPSLMFKMIENELARLELILNNSIRPAKKEFVFIFKEMISIDDAKKIRTAILKIPLYVLHYASVPYKTNTVDFIKFVKKPLLAGICGDSILTYKIKNVKYCSKPETSLNPPDLFIKVRYY